MESEGENKRPCVFAWIAAIFAMSLILIDQIAKGSGIVLLSKLGTASFLFAAVFMFPPFYLLRKYGKVETGKSYTYTTEMVDRVTSAIVRHPQYLGYALLALGFMLRSQHAAVLITDGIAIVAIYIQAVWEERFCHKQPGRPFEQYCRQVPRSNFPYGLARLLMKRRKAG